VNHPGSTGSDEAESYLLFATRICEDTVLR
jgi:hypothetical protein